MSHLTVNEVSIVSFLFPHHIICFRKAMVIWIEQECEVREADPSRDPKVKGVWFNSLGKFKYCSKTMSRMQVQVPVEMVQGNDLTEECWYMCVLPRRKRY